MGGAMKRVVIVGAGFAGLNAAKGLGRVGGLEVTLLDERNHLCVLRIGPPRNH